MWMVQLSVPMLLLFVAIPWFVAFAIGWSIGHRRATTHWSNVLSSIALQMAQGVKWERDLAAIKAACPVPPKQGPRPGEIDTFNPPMISESDVLLQGRPPLTDNVAQCGGTEQWSPPPLPPHANPSVAMFAAPQHFSRVHLSDRAKNPPVCDKCGLPFAHCDCP